MRPLLVCLYCAVLMAAEPPSVPDPYGLGERLALIVLLQDTYHIRPTPETPLEALRSTYAQAWQRTQIVTPGADSIPDAQDEAAQSAARARRLRDLISRRHRVDAEAGQTETELIGLLRRLDGEKAERDAAAITALAAGDPGGELAPTAPAAPVAAPIRPGPAHATPAQVPVAATAAKVRRIVFKASGVTGCALVEDGGISALLVVFGLDHNGAFNGLPEAMIAALHGAPGIRRAVLLLGHGTGNTINGESIETHLKANRAFYETLGNTAPALPIECLVFASCAAGNPDQMRAMRDGLGYFPTWRVATAARSYANGPTVLAALRATAARPSAPA